MCNSDEDCSLDDRRCLLSFVLFYVEDKLRNLVFRACNAKLAHVSEQRSIAVDD